MYDEAGAEIDEVYSEQKYVEFDGVSQQNKGVEKCIQSDHNVAGPVKGSKMYLQKKDCLPTRYQTSSIRGIENFFLAKRNFL